MKPKFKEQFANIVKGIGGGKREEAEEALTTREGALKDLPDFLSRLKRDLEKIEKETGPQKIEEVLREYQEILAGGKYKDYVQGSLLLLSRFFLQTSNFSDPVLEDKLSTCNELIQSAYNLYLNSDEEWKEKTSALKGIIPEVLSAWENVKDLNSKVEPKQIGDSIPVDENSNEKNYALNRLFSMFKLYGPDSWQFIDYLNSVTRLGLVKKNDFIELPEVREHTKKVLFDRFKSYGPGSWQLIDYLNSMSKLDKDTKQEFLNSDEIINLANQVMSNRFKLYGPNSWQFTDYRNELKRIGFSIDKIRIVKQTTSTPKQEDSIPK